MRGDTPLQDMQDTGYLTNTTKSMKDASNPVRPLPDILGFSGSSVFSRISIRSPQPSRVGCWVAEEGLAGSSENIEKVPPEKAHAM